MATYAPSQLGITASTTGGQFQQGAWYGGRQAWQDPQGNWTLGEVNQINPYSNQQGAGQQVSQEVQNQSAKAQGVTPQQFGNYLTQQASNAGTQAPQTLTGSNASGAAANAGASGLSTNTSTGSTNTSSDVANAQQAVKNIQDQINARQAAAAAAIKNENDNPFYSESNRVGRIAKINEGLNADLAPLTQQLTDAQAAYDTAVKANTPNLQTIQSTDNNGNLTLLTIDKNTGKVVQEQAVGGVGKAKTTASSKTDSNGLTKADYQNYLVGDIQNGADLASLMKHYEPYLTPSEIYHLYAANSPYGAPKETLTQAESGQFADKSGFKSKSSSSTTTL